MKRHFVLVHGACHGAWCWYKLTTLLMSGGHRVTALDLSASGIDPKQARDLQSVSDYSQPLMKFMDSLPATAEQKVILIAHSLGGVSVTNATETYSEKISVAVFVSALMPGPELSVSTLLQETTNYRCFPNGRNCMQYFRRQGSLMDSVFTFDYGPENRPTSFIFGSNFMLSNLYQLCAPEDFTLATMLVRPTLPISGENDSLEEVTLTHERYGSVSRVYIVADEDKAVKKDFQGWMIEKNPTDEVKEITGADHMVMLSKPHELFSCLEEIVANYNCLKRIGFGCMNAVSDKFTSNVKMYSSNILLIVANYN